MAEVEKVKVFTDGYNYVMLKLLYRESRTNLPDRIFLDDYIDHMHSCLGFFGFSNNTTYIAIREDFNLAGDEEQLLQIARRVEQFGKNVATRMRLIIKLDDKIDKITSPAFPAREETKSSPL